MWQVQGSRISGSPFKVNHHSLIPTIITRRQIIKRAHRVNYNNLSYTHTHKLLTNNSQKKSSVSLKMALLNKTFFINHIIVENNIDCMFLTETWLGTDGTVTLIESTPPDHSFLYSTRSERKGGGTATILATSLGFKQTSLDEYSSLEYHAFVFSSPPILCVCVYRPPKRSTSVLTEFSEMLSIIHTNYDRVIILGDFNVHVDNQLDTLASDFINVLNSMDFKQHVLQSTHIKGHTLDLVITRGLLVQISSVTDVGLSDHYCVFFTVNDFKQIDPPERMVRKRFITDQVAENFIEHLTETPRDILMSSCDSMIDSLNSKLRSTLDTVAPIKLQKTTTKASSPWRNEKI